MAISKDAGLHFLARMRQELKGLIERLDNVECSDDDVNTALEELYENIDHAVGDLQVALNRLER